jgi:hypothetical protein
MIANIRNEIDLTNNMPTSDYIMNHLDNFEMDIRLEPKEFVNLFKSYVSINLDIDLDELDILVILDLKSNRIALDMAHLEEDDIEEWLYIIDEFKIHFGRSVFSLRTSLSLPIVLRKILANCSMYKWNTDGSISITYSLLDITNAEIGQYLNL